MQSENKKCNEALAKCKMATGIFAGIALAAILVLLMSCSPRIVEKIVTEYRDTTIYKETIKDTTILVPIPLGKDQAIVHVNDTSHLETQIAFSDAFVGHDGFLHHSLENKQSALPVVVPIKSMTIYTNVVDKTAQTITKIEYRDKPLSWWQSFKIRAFWWLLAGLILSLCWIFRKPLVAILKTLLKL